MSGIWLASFVILWVFTLLLAYLLAGALRQIGLMTLRLGDDPGALFTDAGLDRGTQAPEFEGIDVESGEVRKSMTLSQQPRVLVFLSSSCISCQKLVPHLNEVIETRRGEFDFVAVCRGDLESCRTFKWRERLRAPLIVDMSGEIEAAFDVRLTPFVYVLDYEGRVLVRGVANDWRHLESLLEQEGTIQSAPWTLVEEPST